MMFTEKTTSTSVPREQASLINRFIDWDAHQLLTNVALFSQPKGGL